jgi:hypothetical protein
MSPTEWRQYSDIPVAAIAECRGVWLQVRRMCRRLMIKHRR